MAINTSCGLAAKPVSKAPVKPCFMARNAKLCHAPSSRNVGSTPPGTLNAADRASPTSQPGSSRRASCSIVRAHLHVSCCATRPRDPRLEAPIASFGTTMVQGFGPITAIPSTALLTGLAATAPGWSWREPSARQSLQGRIVATMRADRPIDCFTDLQNARLHGDDSAWTTGGVPARWRGASYAAPHQRFREYHQDLLVHVVLRLAAAPTGTQSPSLELLADALRFPAKALYIGRKPCIPSAPLIAPEPNCWITAANAHAALCAIPGTADRMRAAWPPGEGPTDGPDVEAILPVPGLHN